MPDDRDDHRQARRAGAPNNGEKPTVRPSAGPPRRPRTVVARSLPVGDNFTMPRPAGPGALPTAATIY